MLNSRVAHLVALAAIEYRGHNMHENPGFVAFFLRSARYPAPMIGAKAGVLEDALTIFPNKCALGYVRVACDCGVCLC
jgi:hypothetical protein